MNSNSASSAQSGRYLNGVLTAIAALLALLLMQQTIGLPGPGEAVAQRSGPDSLGVPNAAEQRARMIRILEAMDGRLRSVEGRFEKPVFDVRVVEMPPVKIAE